MAKQEKVTCGRVLPRARVASASRSLELNKTLPPAWKRGLLPYVNWGVPLDRIRFLVSVPKHGI